MRYTHRPHPEEPALRAASRRMDHIGIGASWFAQLCEASSGYRASAPPHHEGQEARRCAASCAGRFPARPTKIHQQSQADLGCPVPQAKINLFSFSEIYAITGFTPRRRRDGSRSSRYVGAGCDGRSRRQVCSMIPKGSCSTKGTGRSAGRGRQSRVVLAPRPWRQVGGKLPADDGGKKRRSPGRARNKP